MANVSSSNGIEKYPKLRFPEFTEPWAHIKLSDFAERIIRKNKNNETELPLTISSKDGLVDQISFFNKTVASKDMSGYYLLMNGEYAYNKSYSVGYAFGSIKRLERYPMGALSTLYICFAPKRFNSDFIKTYFDSLKWYKEIYMISAEGARNHGLLNVPTDEFFDTYHYITENETEQEKIAKLMGLIEQRIEKQQALVDNLKKYKRGLLDKLLEDNSTDANWHIVRLQDVANGFDYGMNSAATTFDGVHKYIRITDIDDDSRQYLSDDIVSPSDTPEEKYRVSDNDILFARTGASVGKSYLYTLDDGELYFAGFLIRISVKNEYDSYFVDLNTLTSKYGKWLRLESMRSGQPGVNAEQYRNYAFRCPNYQTQVKIANIIKGIDLRILKERMSLSKLNSLKNGLLQQLFI